MQDRVRLILSLSLGLFSASLLWACGEPKPIEDVSGLRDPTPRRDTFVYKTVGDRALTLDVYLPGSRLPPAPRPAILFIHGGGWAGGSPDHFIPYCRYFASRGMVAINVSYRLVHDPYRQRRAGTIFDAADDVADALAWVHREGERIGVDRDRIALAGESAGAHLAAMTVIGYESGREDGQAESSDTDSTVRPHASQAFTAEPEAGAERTPQRSSHSSSADRRNPAPDAGTGVASSGSKPPRTNQRRVAAMILIDAPVDLAPFGWARLIPGLHGFGDDKQRAVRRASPIHRVRPGLPPTLMLHGEQDRIVPVEQARRFARAMRETDNRCELIVYPDTGHAFALLDFLAPPHVVVRAIRAIDRFLGELGWLEGDPTIRAASHSTNSSRSGSEAASDASPLQAP